MNKYRNMIMAGIIKESIELDFKLNLPKEIKILNNAFKKAGEKIYIVGGSVRDALLGKEPKDYDIATSSSPELVTKILNDFDIYNFPKGEAFGVVSAIINKQEFEIATFRSEKYDGSGRRPTEVEISTIEQDALRRDLTINSLYYDIENGKIIDLVGGIEDIKNGIIKTVGNPEDRMYDDRLRVMRAVRFKNITDGKLDNETKKAIIKYSEMPGVSNERIRDEFYSGLYKSKRPESLLKDLYDFGIMKRMFPKMNINTNFKKDLRNPILVVSSLVKENDRKEIEKMLTEMKYQKEEKNTINFLLKFFDFFKHFSKLNSSFSEYKEFDKLTDLKKIVFDYGLVDSSDLFSWGEISGIDRSVINSFLKFEKRNSKDIPEIEEKIKNGDFPSVGKEIGDETRKVNFLNFISSI